MQFKHLLYLSPLFLYACQLPTNQAKVIQTTVSDSVSVCHVGAIPSRFAPQDRNLVQYGGTGKDGVKMVFIQGGTFKMGSNSFPDAQPIHDVVVSSFYMDEHEVTNRQFAAFVKATGYVTLAERPLDPKEFPDADPAMLVPGSAVFTPVSDATSLSDYLQWWSYVPGANWKQPEGPDRTIKGREDHPVTQLAYQDAEAYAKWVGKRLPTEAEWEYAAKAGKHVNETYYWGTEKKEKGRWLANIYQGEFPKQNSKEDGFETTAPVKSFPSNAWGLYDLEGNVWEWCSDYYKADYYATSPKTNPKGPAESHDPQEPGMVKRVQRGGSFLCNDQYCERYKAGSRGKGEVNSPTNNVGFRCVQDIKQ
ncbi:formylglycine-generating enzyme family protein [Sphingobacterium psychroaquaticum]|uniref:Formylglycine-generating enzyme, required for sulfatase activity, contains SUMF1/FGE domain n=1 Tax=Sphingobacterium psychroaquaticum TaxID=561061 RepID=A0A1X7LAK3_9SPHI|nr:formylglycine-generating enzyme family protein [Sphingobacterium psychroaquaticum]SMG50189.1 Formylglycine-generating enzyme, required for sulfatase activity, contains SUMF1/FGE domain [Sphingobacterium psychroaquaticum]